MKSTFPRFARLLAAVFCIFLLGPHPHARAGAVIVIHSFQNSNDGYQPDAALTAGTDGFLYGTTYNGGGGTGLVFKISTGGSFTPLHALSYSAEGGYLYNGVAFGPDGNLYGQAYQGGPNSVGTIFRVTTSGSFSLLYSLSSSGSGGEYPEYTKMVTGTDGNLYGTNYEGGTHGYGTIFQLTTSGSFTPIHQMDYSTDGGDLGAGLCVGPDGNLYGTSYTGGSNGGGTVFRVTTSGSLTVIHSFNGGSDGANPYAPLIAGTDGNLYGTTTSSGTGGHGTVFQVAPTPGGAFTVLHSFTDTNGDGSSPQGGLVQAPNGAFYGVTYQGGDSDYGTIFKLIVSGSTATYKTVHSFSYYPDGAYPYGGMATGSDGLLYGTASSGGSSGDGVVYQFNPLAPEYTYLPLSGQSSSQVQFNATVNPNYTPTSAYFQWDTNSSSYGNDTPVQVLGSGSNDIVLSASLSGLASSTTYYYRVVVSSSTYGTYYGSQQSFTTLNVPTLAQGPAINVTNSTATLTGTVNSDSEYTQVLFLYGPTNSYGSQSSSVYLGNSTDNVAISIPVAGLMPNTPYHYLLETTGSAGTFYGSDATFTTGSSALTITENPAQNVNSFGALLSGTINPNGLTTYAWFQYGLSSSYTNSTGVQAIGNSTTPATILASLTGLASDTQYHYAITGSSGSLVVTGSDMTFTTPPVNPGITQNSAGNVGTAGASLSASVNPGGLDAQAYFVYGLNGLYGSQTPTVDLGNGTTTLGLDATLSGLLAGQQYHYELVVTNSNGTYYGGDETFTTGSTPGLVASAEARKGDVPVGAPGTIFSTFGAPIINANGHVAFSAVLAASGTTKVTSANNAGIWADNSGGVRYLVARASGTAAGVSGATYNAFGSPVYNDSDEIAFVAGLKLANGTSSGIFTNIGGSLNVFRMQGNQADGVTTGVLYAAFKGLVLTDASLVFQATLTGSGVASANNTGIWLLRFATGQTQLIARTGTVDPSTGKTIKTLTIFPVVPVVAGQSRNTDAVAGNIAYQATFTDGTSAVLKAVAP